MKNLIALSFTFVILFSNVIYAENCEKETGRKSIQCVDEKLRQMLSTIEEQENRIKSLENNANHKVLQPASPSNEAPNLPNELNQNNKIQKGDYVFEFEKCINKTSKKIIECSFFVTNQVDEHIVWFGNGNDWPSRLYLQSGGSAEASEIFIGTSGGNSNSLQSFSFPSNVAIKGRAVFQMTGEKISLFQFKLTPEEDRKAVISIDFKNIKVQTVN